MAGVVKGDLRDKEPEVVTPGNKYAELRNRLISKI